MDTEDARGREPRRRRSLPALILRSLLITAYSFCVLWFFFDGQEWKTLAEMEFTPDGLAAGVLGAVLWLVLAAGFVRGVLGSDARGAYLKSHIGVPLLLASVVFTWVVWLPVIALALIVLGFIFELPRHPNSQELITAFALIAFISAIVAIGLVRVERIDPSSQLRTLGDALSWTTARLLLSGEMGIDTMRQIQPRTADGRSLATVLAVCATLFAALFVGAVVSWLTKPPKDGETRAGSDLAALTAEVAGLRKTIEGLLAEGRLAEHHADRDHLEDGPAEHG